MLHINKVHHIAIICADYEKSKRFYTDILGLTVIGEVYRAERQSWKLDLALNATYTVEPCSFPNPPKRPSKPEASGLRHLAFEVDDVSFIVGMLLSKQVFAEPTRIVEFTGKPFTFISDPNGLPIEFSQK